MIRITDEDGKAYTIEETPAAPQYTLNLPLIGRGARRNRLITRLMAVPCPDCGAPAATVCDMDVWQAGYTHVRSEPPIVVHTARLLSAIAARQVSRTALLRCWEGGPPPAELLQKGH